MNKYRETWDQSHYSFTSPRDYRWRDTVSNVDFETAYPKHEPLSHKIIGSVCFIGILILLMLL